jgi:CheY-like chemotaxis protein
MPHWRLPWSPLSARRTRPAARGSTGYPRSLASWRPGATLLADDNESNRIVAARQLEVLGYRFLAVDDGQKAVTAFSREPFDAVLMDCRMPVMDGYEATRCLRLQAHGSDVPIITVTASALKEDVELCLAAGMSDYLAKPIQLSDLAAVLDRWLL